MHICNVNEANAALITLLRNDLVRIRMEKDSCSLYVHLLTKLCNRRAQASSHELSSERGRSKTRRLSGMHTTMPLPGTQPIPGGTPFSETQVGPSQHLP